MHADRPRIYFNERDMIMMFGTERYMYIGGPRHGAKLVLTHSEDVRICKGSPGGQYRPEGLGDDSGRLANRRVWTTDIDGSRS